MEHQSIRTNFLLMIYKNNKYTKYLLVSKIKTEIRCFSATNQWKLWW